MQMTFRPLLADPSKGRQHGVAYNQKGHHFWSVTNLTRIQRKILVCDSNLMFSIFVPIKAESWAPYNFSPGSLTESMELNGVLQRADARFHFTNAT